MTVHDGNGWTRCGRGHRHWGRHGAAGLLVATERLVLLAQRSWWGSYGGAWGPPGGARDSHESPVHAALREASEECAIDASAVRVHGISADDHGGWIYRTVLASAPAPVRAAAVSEEITKVAWVPVAEVPMLPLHPGFAAQWPLLRTALAPPVVVVDAANVMGSRPDGWWRDRAGAARRLCDQLAALAQDGVAELADLGGSTAGLAALERSFPRFVVVLEGAAIGAVDGVSWPAIQVVRAKGHGDDEIVRQAVSARTGGQAGQDATGRPVLVVTADRELRARCVAAGAHVTGPRWLLDQLAPVS